MAMGTSLEEFFVFEPPRRYEGARAVYPGQTVFCLGNSPEIRAAFKALTDPNLPESAKKPHVVVLAAALKRTMEDEVVH